MEALGQIVSDIVTTSLTRLAIYIPQFFGGLIILLIGLLVAAILHRIVIEFFKLVKIEKWLEEAKIVKTGEIDVWPNLLAELVRWTTIILFLVPAVEAWGIPRVTEVLNQLLFYLPNVFVAVVIGLIGIIIANLTYDITKQAVKNLGGVSGGAIAGVARYAILFFTALIVLNQLGVAAVLIQTLFTGIVAMLALAGGLAFGLGGQETARDILRGVREKLEK